MLKLDKNITLDDLIEESKNIESFNNAQIALHELNKTKNIPVVFKVINNLPSGMILIDDLTEFSQGIQKIYRKAVNSNIPNSKKRVKKFIKDSTGLVISDIRAGSFEIELKQHRTQVIDIKSNLDFEHLTGNIREHSLKLLTKIIDFLYLEKIDKIILEYDLETFKASKEWLKNLEKSNNNFKYSDNKKNYIFTNTKIERLNKLLDTLNEEFEENIEIKGVLSVVNHHNSTITIMDTHSKNNYYIKVNDSEFKNSGLLTNKEVIAQVKLHEITINDEVISSNIYLDSLKNLKIV